MSSAKYVLRANYSTKMAALTSDLLRHLRLLCNRLRDFYELFGVYPSATLAFR